jgi:hypothetical protein
MKALVYKKIIEFDNGLGWEINQTIQDDETFEVHSDFMWIDCDDTISKKTHFYDPETNQFTTLLPDIPDVLTQEEINNLIV